MSASSATMLFANSPSKLPRWTNTLLVAAIGFVLAMLTIKLLPTSTAVVNTSATLAPTRAVDSPDPLQLARLIAKTHLFGDATKTPEVKKDTNPIQPQVETRLNLVLAGVFAYLPKEKAIAIISAGSAEQSAYGIGDKVSGETTLKAVFPEYVVLDNRGREEILRLPENVQPIAMRPIQNSAGRSSNSNRSGAGVDPGAPIDLPTSPGALRDALARNPSMLGRIVAAEPYQENGKLLGYRITPKQNPEILESQGILAGDIITRVNNIQLNSQKQGIRALRNAVKADNLNITILRDGVEVPITISLAQ